MKGHIPRQNCDSKSISPFPRHYFDVRHSPDVRPHAQAAREQIGLSWRPSLYAEWEVLSAGMLEDPSENFAISARYPVKSLPRELPDTLPFWGQYFLMPKLFKERSKSVLTRVLSRRSVPSLAVWLDLTFIELQGDVCHLSISESCHNQWSYLAWKIHHIDKTEERLWRDACMYEHICNQESCAAEDPCQEIVSWFRHKTSASFTTFRFKMKRSPKYFWGKQK